MSSFLNPPFIISILIAISVHEWAHGRMAYRLGDPTAADAGRLTLNPLAHLDLIGAVVFLLVGFGWARPVPINPAYFRSPKRDEALTALAGPFANLCMAWIAFVFLLFLIPHEAALSAMGLLHVANESSPLLLVFLQILASSLFVNLALMSFNLLPLAPLDGSKILHAFIPLAYEREYERFMQHGPFLILGLLLFESFTGLGILQAWVFGIMDVVLSAMGWIAGFVT